MYNMLVAGSADKSRVVVRQRRYCFLYNQQAMHLQEYLSPKVCTLMTPICLSIPYSHHWWYCFLYNQQAMHLQEYLSPKVCILMTPICLSIPYSHYRRWTICTPLTHTLQYSHSFLPLFFTANRVYGHCKVKQKRPKSLTYPLLWCR